MNYMNKMKMSHSKVDLFKRCPYHFNLKYIEKATELDKFEANSPLKVGNAIHYGIEVDDKDKMVEYYYSMYPVITDLIINESIKLEMAFDKVMPIVRSLNIKHQEYLIDEDDFVGIVDLITDNGDGTVDIFDFKYSNSVDSYNNSYQLHIYRYYLELQGYKVNRMGYIFIPKTFIRQKRSEDLVQFRKRIIETYKDLEVQLVEVEHDDMAMIYYLNEVKEVRNALDNVYTYDFVRNPNGECFQCRFGQDYQEIIYMEDGTEMILPVNKRREKKLDLTPDMWVYADSYVGKSTFIDSFDDVLFINTDGNTDNTTSPVVPINDKTYMEGRIKKTEFGWEKFKEVVIALTTEETSYKFIAVDLLEDLYEMCRTYVFDKEGIEHESDAGFGKGWDKVRTEFINEMKKLKAIGYSTVFISKELRTEVKEKSGHSYTTFKPNVNDKIANVVSGIVDLTIHLQKEDDKRFINLIPDEYTFGGGRFDFKVDRVNLDRKEFEKALEEAQEDRKVIEEPKEEPKTEETPFKTDTLAADVAEEIEEKRESGEMESPTRRRRRA